MPLQRGLFTGRCCNRRGAFSSFSITRSQNQLQGSLNQLQGSRFRVSRSLNQLQGSLNQLQGSLNQLQGSRLRVLLSLKLIVRFFHFRSASILLAGVQKRARRSHYKFIGYLKNWIFLVGCFVSRSKRTKAENTMLPI